MRFLSQASGLAEYDAVSQLSEWGRASRYSLVLLLANTLLGPSSSSSSHKSRFLPEPRAAGSFEVAAPWPKQFHRKRIGYINILWRAAAREQSS